MIARLERRKCREVHRGDLARARHACLHDFFLRGGCAEALGCTVEFALFDSGSFELQEHALVLDGSRCEAGCLLTEFFFFRLESFRLAAVHDEHSAQLAPFEDGHSAHGLHGATVGVVRQDEGRLKIDEADRGALR